MDNRINPDTDFVFNEAMLLENVVDTLRKLPIYASHYARCKTDAEVTEQQLKNIQARVALEIRTQKTDVKLTDKTVETIVANNEMVLKAQDDLTNARSALYYADGYWRSIQKACDLLQMMGYARNAEMKRM